ncbi:hypothetical protein ACEN9F_03435 [Duganella sp. CT11-25]|uniref:hypothetical protein n=1 Tax=unclassified Duganella TaxID=2636909 RepID=UPI0039B0B842
MIEPVADFGTLMSSFPPSEIRRQRLLNGYIRIVEKHVSINARIRVSVEPGFECDAIEPTIHHCYLCRI